jgi:hypothetical protein
MSGRSIFDITDQNFGRLDETIKVANDNSISLNAEVTEDLIIGDYEGDVKKKDAIALQGLTFNNVFAAVEEEPTGVKGLLDPDGIDDYVQYATTPDTTGNKTINFNLYLLKESGYSTTGLGNLLFVFSNGGGDYAAAFLYNNQILISTTNTGYGNNRYSLSGFGNSILSCKIIKTASSQAQFYINDVLQSSVTTLGGIGITGSLVFGGPGFVYLNDAYVWNLIIESTFNAPGQPNGNQASAWTNDTFISTVVGNPSTIDIP